MLCPPSPLTLCRRCWLNSEGGEHHSRELVNRGSGARRTSSFPGFFLHSYTHKSIKYRNTSTRAFIRCKLFDRRCQLFSSRPRWDSRLIRQWNIHHVLQTLQRWWILLMNKLICCFYSNSAPAMHIYWDVKVGEVCLFYFLQVPTPILSMEMSSKQVRPHSHPFYSHTVPTLFLHVFSALMPHTFSRVHMPDVAQDILFFIPNSFMYSIFLSLFSLPYVLVALSFPLLPHYLRVRGVSRHFNPNQSFH